MFLYILTLLITVPLIELVILIKVNEFIGIQWTFLIIILTGISGSYLLKRQGIKIVSKIRSETSAGHIPGDKIIEGLLLFAGGIMLLFPGYATDTLGLLLMIPGNRRVLRSFIQKKMKRNSKVTVYNTFDENGKEL
ncbi:FxsA family protein [Planctomycetota bacterium]